MAWYHRVWNVLRPERLSRNLDREMEFHLAERTDDLIAAGMAPEEAAREAERRFGNRMLQKDRTRDVDVVVWLESLVADLRYAARGIRRSPGFALVVVLSLALGIGANTAIFSLTNALLLRSLPVPDPGSLVRIVQASGTEEIFTNPLWEELRDRQDVFSGMFAYAGRRFDLSTGGLVRRASGALVSGGFFPTLGVVPAAGRLLGPSDDRPGCPSAAVVSDGFARREYGGDAAVGRTLTLDGQTFSIVGVAEPGFSGINVGSSVDVYVPLCTEPVLVGDPDVLSAQSRWYLQLVGRLKEGVTPEQAEARVQALAPSIYEETLPEHYATDDQEAYLGTMLEVLPAPTGLSSRRDRYGRALMILTAIVALVLLVACANIANLLLARAAARQQESAMRQALGAGRARLVRQLLTETVLLSLIGAAMGVLFAGWASRLLVDLLARRGDSFWLDLSPDGRVLGFTLAVAVATGLLFGLAPAWSAAKADPLATTRGGARGLPGGGVRHRAGKALVLGQVAVSLVLVVSAGLLVGSFRTLSTLDPGFRREGVMLVHADFANAGFEGERRAVARRELLGRLRALPGVETAATSMITPVGGMMWTELIAGTGYTPNERTDAMAYFNTVSGSYFSTLGTPLLAGRDLREADGEGAPRVAVVNRAFVERFFGGESPLGQAFSTRDGDSTSDPVEVVGVVGDAKYNSLREEPPPTVYLPFGQGDEFGSGVSIVLRSDVPPDALSTGVQQAVAEVSPEITLDVTSLSDQLAASLTRSRLLATLSGFFGVLALLLAVIGLYGTLSYAVTRRRGEIGVRMALGASARSVLRMVFTEAGLLVLGGIVVGGVVTLATMRLIASFLYGVEPTDPVTFAVATGVLALTALGAALLPAARAAAVEPIEVLRE
jgi:predicted permease